MPPSNNHPAIIDRDLWNKVQVEIARRASKRKRPSKDAHSSSSKFSGKYALNEVLVCGECGANYRHVMWTVRGEKVPVWRCISRLEHGKKICKKSVTIKEDRLHEILLFAINQSVFKELLFEAMADSAVALDMPELVPEISSMILSDPPELLEYDDRYARLLFHRIEVKGEALQITFRDGTCVVQSL